jgi:hypothetical protein
LQRIDECTQHRHHQLILAGEMLPCARTARKSSSQTHLERCEFEIAEKRANLALSILGRVARGLAAESVWRTDAAPGNNASSGAAWLLANQITNNAASSHRDNGSIRTGSEHFLDHPQAERKSEIEPNRVRDHLGGKAMPAIERIASLFQAPPLPANRPCLVKLADCFRVLV